MLVFFFFKQKTAYEMRISDWSSDVCSSDLWCSVWQFGKLELSHVSGSPVREYQILMHHQPHRRAGPDRNSRLDAKVMLGDLAPARATLSCVDIRIACTRSLWPDRASSELTPSSVESAAPFTSCQVWKSHMTSTFHPRPPPLPSAP